MKRDSCLQVALCRPTTPDRRCDDGDAPLPAPAAMGPTLSAIGNCSSSLASVPSNSSASVNLHCKERQTRLSTFWKFLGLEVDRNTRNAKLYLSLSPALPRFEGKSRYTLLLQELTGSANLDNENAPLDRIWDSRVLEI